MTRYVSRLAILLVASVFVGAAAQKAAGLMQGGGAPGTIWGDMAASHRAWAWSAVVLEMAVALWPASNRAVFAAIVTTVLILSVFLGLVIAGSRSESPRPCGCALPGDSLLATDPSTKLVVAGCRDVLLMVGLSALAFAHRSGRSRTLGEDSQLV